MESKFKISIIFILALLMCFGSLTGCQPVKRETEKDLDLSKPTISDKELYFNETGYPIVDEEITVTTIYSERANYYPDDPDEVLYWKKLRELTNIKIDFTYIENDATAVNLFFATSEFPDFFIRNITPDRLYEYGVKGGSFLDISDMIYKYMPHLVSRFKEYPDMEKAMVELNSKVYGIPMYRGGTTAFVASIFYRKDYLEKLELKQPDTVDEFYDICKAIKNSGLTQGYAPYHPASKGLGVFEPLFFPAFGEAHQAGFADDGKGNVVYNKITEQYKHYLEYANKLYKDGLMENEYLSLDSATLASRVKSGQVAFCYSMSNLVAEDFLDGKMGIGCLSPMTSQFSSTKKTVEYNHVSVGAGAINKNSKYPEAILRMLDIGYAKEEVAPGTGLDAEAINHGIEGITYVIDKDTNTQVFLQPEDSDEPFYVWLRTKHGWNAQYGVLDTMYYNNAANPSALERSMVASLLPYEKPALKDNLFKFTEDEKEIIVNKMMDVDKYMTEMVAKFITGVEPLSNWDNYVETIKKMGIDDVIEVKQTGYDRWGK
jgi:putative aldouronate transport system substrate-binding protein